MRKISTKSLFAASFFCFLTVGFAEKMRLGDIPEELSPREQKKLKAQQEAEEEPMTPEERKLLLDEVAADYYKKGVLAMKEERYAVAQAYFEKTLILTPNNQNVKQLLQRIREKQKPPAPKPQPPKPVESPAPVRIEKKPVVSKPVLSSQEIKEKSESLYMKALSASQNGRYEEAYDLCQQVLTLDANNLQARRMSERLESRFGTK